MMVARKKTVLAPASTLSIAVMMVANRVMATQTAAQPSLSVARTCAKGTKRPHRDRQDRGRRIASVSFAVKDGVRKLVSKAPFTARLPLEGRTKRYTVTAAVTDSAGHTTTLSKLVKGCA